LLQRPVLAEDKAPSIEVSVNQSKVLWLEVRSKTVSVTQPEIADVVVLAPNQLLINGKFVGATSLIVWNERGGITNFTLNVTPNVVGLRKQLQSLFPEEPIEVSASASALVLKGEVSNEVVYDKVLSVARTYLPPKQRTEVAPAPATGARQAVNIRSSSVHLPQTGTAFAGGGQLAFTEESAYTDTERWGEQRRIPGLIDLLVIRDFRQIQVNVVVAEIGLSKLRELGVDLGVVTGHANALSRIGSQGGFSGGNLWSDPSGFPPTTTFGQSASGLFSYLSSGASISAVYRLLQNKDVTQILAQPNLVIKNGRSGGFLAGGEFPIPFTSGGGLGSTSLTVEFKPFGVRLDFLPTLTWSNTIDLQVFPEVSEIDPTVSVTVSGISIPGLRVRRSVSRVEMREGEVLIISGLLDRRVFRDLTKFPFLGDVPVLGALFRSTKFRNQETELVFILTPQVVKASPPGTPLPVPSPRPYEDPDMRQMPLPTPAPEGGASAVPPTITAQPASSVPAEKTAPDRVSIPPASSSGGAGAISPPAAAEGGPTLP
jgi:pilus assembly protein CpaC